MIKSVRRMTASAEKNGSLQYSYKAIYANGEERELKATLEKSYVAQLKTLYAQKSDESRKMAFSIIDNTILSVMRLNREAKKAGLTAVTKYDDAHTSTARAMNASNFFYASTHQGNVTEAPKGKADAVKASIKKAVADVAKAKSNVKKAVAKK